MGCDVKSWGHLAWITLVAEHNKPAVKRPCFRECRGVVYRSIRAASPCLCVFREHCLCFLSIYASLCFSFPPSIPPVESCDSLDTEGDLLLTASHAEWSLSETLSELQIHRPSPPPRFLSKQNILNLLLYSMWSCSAFALLQYRVYSFFWPADNSALLWIKLYMWACCPLSMEKSQVNLIFEPLTPFVLYLCISLPLSSSVSSSFSLPSLSLWLIFFCLCHTWKVTAL